MKLVFFSVIKRIQANESKSPDKSHARIQRGKEGPYPLENHKNKAF